MYSSELKQVNEEDWNRLDKALYEYSKTDKEKAQLWGDFIKGDAQVEKHGTFEVNSKVLTKYHIKNDDTEMEVTI